jgi:hypothetical protein
VDVSVFIDLGMATANHAQMLLHSVWQQQGGTSRVLGGLNPFAQQGLLGGRQCAEGRGVKWEKVCHSRCL